MIVTITMNPSVDISYPLDSFELGTVNRVNNTNKTAGGKGLNVTRVLKELEEDVLASGIIGGFLGEFIQKDLKKAEIKHSFLKTNQETRNCIAILHDGKQTEILEQGPIISEAEAIDFLKHFENIVDNADIISISGSLPRGLATDFYIKMIGICNQKKKPVILDCSGKALAMVLRERHKPIMIKPNTEELSELVGKEISGDIQELKSCLKDALFSGIEWIIVSLGAQGSFAKHGGKLYQVTIPQINVINPVGSGDATVAGLTSALYNQESDHQLLKKANTLGVLNAQEATTGHINMRNYQSIYDQINVAEV